MPRVAYDGTQVVYATGGLNVPHGGLVGVKRISYFAFWGETYSYFGEN